MNGEARAFVMKVVENPKATQHEKLNAIIVLMLSDHDRLVMVEEVVFSYPLSRFGTKVRNAVYAISAAWIVGVTWAFGDFIYEVLRKAGLV